ncbi:MAG: hypothetical protein BGO51_18105 [Rhodospirillales bacterium 69-11]|nr:MAG: hypothetical protein ABS99_00770 [Acetobacteraceae bacterium SCN 69-10]OJW19293.1 MAG: hypothetical protein BGO51_18105 [Rhodospirillales bacterium 69-11]
MVLTGTKCRADVVGILLTEGAIISLIGAVLLEADDEWQLQHRYMQIAPMAELMPHTLDTNATTDCHRGGMIHGHLGYNRFSTALTDVTTCPE